ncbi:MAG TPA: GNAT family N-acetyltransferase [Candidatus Limnocylindrales bacterium]|nr:GNAT family N-acetyltransferase [Candidatus Limnocylindrales bacterium]
MTTVVTRTTLRETERAQLAGMLGVDPNSLPDQTNLLDELALDSIAMMRLLTRMEERGVDVSALRTWPATVGQVLTLLEQAIARNVSISVVKDGETVAIGPRACRAQPAVDPLTPVLSTRTFRLMPVLPDDLGALYGLATRPENCFRWRYRGAPPPVSRFADELWSQVLTQFTVRTVESNQVVGLVVAYQPGPALRHVYLGALFSPEHSGRGPAAQVTALFAKYLFHTYPFHKIYLEVPGFNWAQLSSGEGVLFDVEGVLRDHDTFAGQSWDQRVCAIYRHHLSGTRSCG